MLARLTKGFACDRLKHPVKRESRGPAVIFNAS